MKSTGVIDEDEERFRERRSSLYGDYVPTGIEYNGKPVYNKTTDYGFTHLITDDDGSLEW